MAGEFDKITSAVRRAVEVATHDDVATLTLVLFVEEEKIGIIETGGLKNPLAPIAGIFNSEYGEEVFKGVSAMLTDDAKRMISNILNKKHGDRPCYTCRKFDDMQSHFGCCEHHKELFDGESSNSSIVKIKEGCPFYEEKDSKRD